MTPREKPFCHVCSTNRLWQKWDVIDRAQRYHEPRPVCSENCRRVAAARRALRARSKLQPSFAPPGGFEAAAVRIAIARGETHVMDDDAAPPHPAPRYRIFPEFAGEGILRIVDRPDWEERRAEAVSLNRAAAAEWMA